MPIWPPRSPGPARLVSAESADLLTGDRATAQLFLAAAERARPETAAKWIINDVPRALGESGRSMEQIAASELGSLLAAVDDGSLPTSSAKAVLAELIRTGKPFAELRGQVAAPVADLGPAIDAVIAANPDKAAQYKGGKAGLLGFFVGQVMKSSPGADAGRGQQGAARPARLTRRSAVRRSDPGKSAAIGLLTCSSQHRGCGPGWDARPRIGAHAPSCRRVITDRIVHS